GHGARRQAGSGGAPEILAIPHRQAGPHVRRWIGAHPDGRQIRHHGSGSVGLIAAGSQAPVNRYLLASRPLVFVGRISYPLYLWHWPALSFTRIVIGRSLTAAEGAAAVLFAAVAAYATCRLVEEPIRFGPTRHRAVPTLLWALAAMSI